MRSIPESFYHSKAWKSCRATYLQQHPLCEDCLQRGLYTPAEHVHHIVWLTADNYTDPAISLNHANLRALCQRCHNSVHDKGEPRARRWRVDEFGRIAPLVGAE